jgi:hypothetical protein
VIFSRAPFSLPAFDLMYLPSNEHMQETPFIFYNHANFVAKLIHTTSGDWFRFYMQGFFFITSHMLIQMRNNLFFFATLKSHISTCKQGNVKRKCFMNLFSAG